MKRMIFENKLIESMRDCRPLAKSNVLNKFILSKYISQSNS
jgi:hypothetical protein